MFLKTRLTRWGPSIVGRACRLAFEYGSSPSSSPPLVLASCTLGIIEDLPLQPCDSDTEATQYFTVLHSQCKYKPYMLITCRSCIAVV